MTIKTLYEIGDIITMPSGEERKIFSTETETNEKPKI